MAKQDIKSLTSANSSWMTESVTSTDLQTSCLMRIADASETMAQASKVFSSQYQKMEKDFKFYEEGYRDRGQRIEELLKSNAALRGVVTRMRNKQNS